MQKIRNLDFLIIGAMKSGTTSLHKYLSEHSEIYLPPEKEAPFFSDDDVFGKGYSRYFNDYFREAPPDVLLGTVTPSYMMNPDSPRRIRNTCPDVKLIAVLRDPIERAYSHYQMAVRVKGEMRTFEEVVVEQLQEDRLTQARGKGSYWKDQIVFGEYGRILKEYYDLFPHKQIQIKYMDQLVAEPKVFMADIFDYLGIKEIPIMSLGKKFHDSGSTPVMRAVAHLALNTRLRIVGKYLLPDRLRRRIRFWLGLHRSSAPADIDSRFLISPETQKRLRDIYVADAKILSSLTGVLPYWIVVWQKEREY